MFASWLLTVCFGAVCLQSQCAASLEVQNHKLNVIHEWKYVDYYYDSEEQKQAAININGYTNYNNVPMDIDVTSDGRIFVTVLRLPGVPSSLNILSNESGSGGPLLKPYPNWDAAKTDCSGIMNVFTVAICEDVLYVADNGQWNFTQTCPPRLYMYDLKTDKLLKNITIPMDVAMNKTTGRGRLISPIVECCNQKERNVYISEDQGFAVVAYKSDTGKFCRDTGGPLSYNPALSTITIEDQSFQVTDGVLGMALSCSTRSLYLSPFASLNLVSISQDVLRDSCGEIPMKSYPNILPTQSTYKAMSDTGTLFLGLTNSTSIACWNENRPLVQENMVIIAEDSNLLQFISSIKIKKHPSENGLTEHLWAMSNRFQKRVTETLDTTVVNFRILNGEVSNLIRGTRCEP